MIRLIHLELSFDPQVRAKREPSGVLERDAQWDAQASALSRLELVSSPSFVSDCSCPCSRRRVGLACPRPIHKRQGRLMRRGPKPAKSKEPQPPGARKSPKDDGAKVRDLEKRLAEALEQQTASAEILRV